MNRIGVQSGNWYNYDDPKGSIKFIKECGFDAIDYNIDNKLPGHNIRHGEFAGFFDMSIEEIGASVGFSDTNYFISFFSSYYGMPPKRYRKENKCLQK